MIVIYYQLLKPATVLLWIFCQRIFAYYAATIFVVYNWQKDTDENDDEFVDTIKLCDILGNYYRQCLDLSLKHGEIIHFISIAVV